jgi:aminoglycoside phosphotransferase (APT) family kinase protein
MTAYDLIAEADADDERRLWVRKLINAKDEIVTFVDSRLDGRGAGEYLGFLKGSFNVSFRVGFGNGKPSPLIRFAKPGHTLSAWRDEKVANEVRAIEYLREKTTIPLPHIRCWGSADESPAQLGSFMIMDFVEGIRLSTLLKEPNEDDQADLILNPAIEETTLDTIYDQLADYLLQLSRLEFSSIGAISKDAASSTWAVTGRPLTYNMNELATLTGYPADQLPTTHFESASDYFDTIARQHLLHLKTQRNLSHDAEDVRRRFFARRQFHRLIPQHCIEDAGPFRVFCDDMQPSNMLVDPATLRITALLDFEFTNSMPAQFAYDPPWWLLLRGPDMWLDHYSMDEFLARYVPRMEQFLRALERVEAKAAAAAAASVGDGHLLERQRLSARMRDSWQTGRFWFNYAARTSLDMDDIYWAALHDHEANGDGLSSLDAATRADMEEMVALKIEQRKAYDADYDIRFPEEAESQ